MTAPNFADELDALIGKAAILPRHSDGWYEEQADLRVFLANHAPAIAEVVRAAKEMLSASDQFVADTGIKHGDPITDAADRCRDALAKLEGK